jgi:hypothetical protein
VTPSASAVMARLVPAIHAAKLQNWCLAKATPPLLN